jgi:predicted alpha-1,2-mannosidase
LPSFRFLIRAAALAVLVAVVGIVAAAKAPAGKAADDSPIASVNPFIGTEDEGNTFPGASAPFGMVQLSPDTGHSTGYRWSDPRIRGFSHTHLSGAGCPAMGDVPFMPTTGPVSETRADRYASGYSKQTESARPGSYAVTLSRYGVRAELTSTTRTGWHRYTFPATPQANVMVNVGQADQTTFGSSIRVVGDRQIEGTVVSGHFCSAPNRYTVHFTATFDRPFAGYGTWRDNRLHAGSRSSSAGGRNESDGAFVRFDTRGDRDVVAKVALSYVDVAGARGNLAREAPGFDFDGVRDRAEQQWGQALDRVQVDGGTPDQRASFYSALYRAQLTPTTFSDADGRYAGFDGRVHRTGGRVQYANLSLWDTYRPQNQLLELIVPDVARDVQLSLVADGQQNGGWLPRWPMASGDTNVMTGDPAAPFLVDGYSKGLLKGHERGVFRLLWRNANGVPPWRVGTMGRIGNPDYLRLGYVPFDAGHNVAKDGDDDIHQGGSSTLEYALSDCASSQMASGLGYRWRAAQLRQRAQSYRRLWDWDDRAFRARFDSGRFAQRSSANGSGFHEGTPSQYTWLVPQDMGGLVHLLGGRWRAAQALNRFFANGNVKQWVTEPYGYYGRQTYNPNNEPDLHSPWAYAWVGRPWRTTQMVRVAQSLFVPKPGGLTGNDDLGTMSAWYVFASLGIYPVTSGSPYYALHTPLFPHITVTAGTRRLTIDAPGTSSSSPYIQSVSVGGKPTTRTWVWHGDLLRAGSLTFATGAQPNRGWGTRRQDAPPSPCG